MAQPKFSSPFPRLDLSLDDKKEICRIAKQLVSEVTDGYERFLWNDNGQLDPFRWALIKEREDVRVYHDRQSGPRSDSKGLNGLLTVGTMQGSLDDAMYGVVNHTIDAMRVKSAYTKDMISNCAVLATILEPTLDKPFRSTTIKWGVKSMPLAMRAVSRNRDVVYVESVGTRTLANGERIGYQLVHSIDFKYTQPLPMYVRANISSCALWRQQTPDRTQVFMKSFIDIPDGLMAQRIVKATADSLITVWRGMHVAQMKKLAWLMQRRRASVADEDPDDDSMHRCCAVCGSGGGSSSSTLSMAASTSSRSFSSRHLGRSSSMSSRSAAKSTCTICRRYVCATCRVRRDMCYISEPDRQLVGRRVAFCVPCLSATDRVSAVDVARDEIGGGRAAAVGPLSEIVKGCNSVARFSYSAAVVPVTVHASGSVTPLTRSHSGQIHHHPHHTMLYTPPHHQGHGKRRSMSVAHIAPVKPVPSVAYAASMVREASVPVAAPTSASWVRV